MKKIYKKSVLLLSLALVAFNLSLLTSCDDYLDVAPSDKQTADQVFANKAGFYTVSNGIYDALASDALYGKQMKYDSKNPKWEERDRIVLSKGHAGPVAYSTLAEVGFFPTEWLYTLNDGGTRLPSHTDRLKTPGIDATTGSLGQGTSEAVGIALALDKKGSDAYTYLFVGDGELNEGQMLEDVKIAINGAKPIDFFGHLGSQMPTTEEIVAKIISMKEGK